MKTLINIIIIASFSLAGCYTTGQVSRGDNYSYSDDYSNGDVSYQTFYNELQPYGNWINYPEYGNVWQPYAGAGFRPYETDGRWVSTVDGWAWASNYNWGWAPFHYGRWFYDASIGWAWVPGYEWAPAWVTWGQYNDYYAWAPLAPGINISIGNTWRAPAAYWSFVPRNCINYSNLNRYAVAGNNRTNINNITIINNYNSYNQKDYYHRGPDYQEVSRFIHKSITPVGIASMDRPGSSRVVNKRLEIYRPSISGTGNGVTNNRVIRDPRLQNDTRNNRSAVQGNSQAGSINPNTNRIIRNPELNNSAAGSSADRLGNGINNRVTQENIDNTNRELQQRQIENMRRFRSQTPSQSPAATRQIPQGNLPGSSVQPVRPQQRLQDERIMQRPNFPQQNERIIRPQAPSMPQRSESNPVRTAPAERRINSVQRPSRF